MQPSQLVKKNTRLRKRKDPSSWIDLMCKSLAKNSTSLCLFLYCVCTSVNFDLLKKTAMYVIRKFSLSVVQIPC